MTRRSFQQGCVSDRGAATAIEKEIFVDLYLVVSETGHK